MPLTWHFTVSEGGLHPNPNVCWLVFSQLRAVMSGGAGRWIRWTTTGCVGLLALIAGAVSYLHTHLLVESHRQPGRPAALTSLSVDGMIVSASTTLLTDSLAGKRGGVLPWALLAVGSVASLPADVAVAEPTAAGRVIWPSLALISGLRAAHAPGPPWCS
jgi:hypothetical protein